MLPSMWYLRLANKYTQQYANQIPNFLPSFEGGISFTYLTQIGGGRGTPHYPTSQYTPNSPALSIDVRSGTPLTSLINSLPFLESVRSIHPDSLLGISPPADGNSSEEGQKWSGCAYHVPTRLLAEAYSP